MNLDVFFQPQSIAIVGVSRRNDRHPANVIYTKLHLRYPVRVFPVNPKGGRLQREVIFTSIKEIPGKVDLAIIAARAEFVPDIMADCIASGVGGATVISGGFAESGQQDLQDRMVQIAREADFPFVGPNCLGIYVPDHFDTFFLPGERLVRPDRAELPTRDRGLPQAGERSIRQSSRQQHSLGDVGDPRYAPGGRRPEKLS